MRISERAALATAMAEGHYHIYPAGKLIQLVKKDLNDNVLAGDFDAGVFIKKIKNIDPVSYDGDARNILMRDLETLCSGLEKVDPDYDFESDIDRIMKGFSSLLSRYFGISNYDPTPTKVVSYYFEGYSDIYKDADWFAFNVSPEESRAMKIPIGSYFKKSWISPAHILLSILHEKLHGVYSLLAEPMDAHRNVAWFEEGFCDVFAYLICYKMFLDRSILLKEKTIIEEVNVLDPRKATYHYSMILFINLLRLAGLPFLRALLDVQKEFTYKIDLNKLVAIVRNGQDPNGIIPELYSGKDCSSFERKFVLLRDKYAKEYQLDKADMEVLNLFSMIQPPAAISANEYRAALWFNEQVTKKINEHVIEVDGDRIKPIRDVTDEERRKIDGFNEKILVLAEAVPSDLVGGAEKLANKYFIVKREIGGKIVYSPWQGGLPFRFASGEIRCEFEI